MVLTPNTRVINYSITAESAAAAAGSADVAAAAAGSADVAAAAVAAAGSAELSS